MSSLECTGSVKTSTCVSGGNAPCQGKIDYENLRKARIMENQVPYKSVCACVRVYLYIIVCMRHS